MEKIITLNDEESFRQFTLNGSWEQTRSNSVIVGRRPVYNMEFLDSKGMTFRFDNIPSHGDAVSIVPLLLNSDSKEIDYILLVAQPRPASLGKIIFELPGGNVDEEDSDYLSAARRELLEEMGVSSSIVKLHGFGSVIRDAYVQGLHYYCLALLSEFDESLKNRNLDQSEKEQGLSIIKMPVSLAKKILLENNQSTLHTISGFFMVLEWLRENDYSYK